MHTCTRFSLRCVGNVCMPAQTARRSRRRRRRRARVEFWGLWPLDEVMRVDVRWRDGFHVVLFLFWLISFLVTIYIVVVCSPPKLVSRGGTNVVCFLPVLVKMIVQCAFLFDGNGESALTAMSVFKMYFIY